MSLKTPKPAATLSLDLDNLWIYQRDQGLAEWESYPSFLDLAVPRIVALFEELGLDITIFLIGRDVTVPEHQGVFEILARTNHELANHSFSHPIDFHRSNRETVEAEIDATEKAIESITGKKTVGFRGPSFRLSPIIIETLIERGYQYDASLFPSFIGPLVRRYYLSNSTLSAEQKENARDLFGNFSDGLKPMKPFHWKSENRSLAEIPVTNFPGFRLPIHATYLNFLADVSTSAAELYFTSAMRLCRLTKTPPSFLLHTTDFLGADDPNAPTFLPGFRRSSDRKILLLKNLLEPYKKHFDVVPLRDYVAEIKTTTPEHPVDNCS